MKPTVTIPECTIVYPELFEPSSFKDSAETYKAVFLFDEGTDLSAIEAAIQAAAERKFPNKSAGFYSLLDSPLRDGTEKSRNEDGEIDEGSFYYGRRFINAKTKFRPDVVNIYKEPLKPDEIYGGCRVRAFLRFFGFEYMGKRGVSSSLGAVVKIADGDPIGGGRVSLEQAFEGVFVDKSRLEFSEAGNDVEDIGI